MKWVLLLVVVLLFLWSIRENFDNYADALADVGQTTGYTDTSNPDAPNTVVGTAGTVTTPTGGSDTTTPAPADTASSSPAETSAVPTVPTGPIGTNTTGGSSMAPQTTSGDNKDNKVWGPAYVGMGDNSGLGGLSGPRVYPVLLGPKPKESTMVEGAGVIKQSNSSNKDGLPSGENTGSEENSAYFGTARMPGGADGAGGAGGSRVPGDKDLFPNPYQEFTPSIGSSKTEPVPFLSDFSAFQK